MPSHWTTLHLASWLWYSKCIHPFSIIYPSIIPFSSHNCHPSWSQTSSYDLKRRAAIPAPADVLAGSDVRVTRITQLAGVTKDPAGSSPASPNPDRTSASTGRALPAASNLYLLLIIIDFSDPSALLLKLLDIFSQYSVHLHSCQTILKMFPSWMVLSAP